MSPPVRSAPARLAPVRLASPRNGPDRSTSGRLALLRSEPIRLALGPTNVPLTSKKSATAGAHNRRAGGVEAASNGELRASTLEAHGGDFFGAELDRRGKEVVAFIDAHRSNETDGRRWGVEPICTELKIAPCTYYDTLARPPSARDRQDATTGPELRALEKKYFVFGHRKLWKAARRREMDIGRDQVARLMQSVRA